MADDLEAYLLYRAALGYSKRDLKGRLMTFDRYLREQNAHWDSLKPSFLLEMRGKIQKQPRQINVLLSTLKGLFQFLIRKGRCEENPLQDVPRLAMEYFIPFVFSPVQTEQMLKALCQGLHKTEKRFLIDLAQYLAILLLAGCGMRISEPLRLLKSHYRSDDGTLYIEKTKFKKDRLIPVPKSVCREVENYCCVRQSLIPDDENPFLLAGWGKRPLTDSQVRLLFHRVVKEIGLDREKRHIGNMTFGSPTPHSLRHSFAINTLKGIKDRGESTQRALPVLAAYMGHRNYHYTGAYLKVRDADHLQGLIEFAKAQQKII